MLLTATPSTVLKVKGILLLFLRDARNRVDSYTLYIIESKGGPVLCSFSSYGMIATGLTA